MVACHWQARQENRPIHSPHANRPGSHARTGPSWACGQTRQVRELHDRLVHVRMRNRSSIRSNAVWLPAHRAQKQFLVSTRSTMRMSCAQRSLAPGKRRYEPRKWTGKRNTRSVHPTGLVELMQPTKRALRPQMVELAERASVCTTAHAPWLRKAKLLRHGFK